MVWFSGENEGQMKQQENSRETTATGFLLSAFARKVSLTVSVITRLMQRSFEAGRRDFMGQELLQAEALNPPDRYVHIIQYNLPPRLSGCLIQDKK
jgi:hypothetical protein